MNYQLPSELEREYIEGLNIVSAMIAVSKTPTESQQAFDKWMEIHQPIVAIAADYIRTSNRSRDSQVAQVASELYLIMEKFHRHFPHIRFDVADFRAQAMEILEERRAIALSG